VSTISREGQRSLLQKIVERVIVATDRIDIRLSRAKIAVALEAGESQRPDFDPVVVSIEAKLRRAGKGKRLVIENGAKTEVNPSLTTMIAEAFAIRNQLLSGSDASIEAMTERLGLGRVTSLRLFDCPI
jgi:site-specific DNA recombinase